MVSRFIFVPAEPLWSVHATPSLTSDQASMAHRATDFSTYADSEHASSPAESPLPNLRACCEAGVGSGFDRFGFVDLASYDDELTEAEQTVAMTRPHYFDAAVKTGALEELEEIVDRSFKSTSTIQLASYRAWIGARSLHIC